MKLVDKFIVNWKERKYCITYGHCFSNINSQTEDHFVDSKGKYFGRQIIENLKF